MVLSNARSVPGSKVPVLWSASTPVLAARAVARGVGAAPHHVAIAGKNALVAVNGTGRVAVVSHRGRLLTTVGAGEGPHGITAVPALSGEMSASTAGGCR